MVLYGFAGACSLAPHVLLRELALPFDYVHVDVATRRTADGGDFLAVQPLGYVPALRLASGEVLAEGPAILCYLADLRPDAGWAPPATDFARYRLLAWLNFLATEVHQAFGALFDDSADAETTHAARDRLFRRFDWLEAELAPRDWLMGPRIGVADLMLFNALQWCAGTGIALPHWPALRAFHERVAGRPAVQAALVAEHRAGDRGVPA